MKKSLILLFVFFVSACETVKVRPPSSDYVFSEKPDIGYVFGTLSQTFVEKNRSKIFDDTYTSYIYIDTNLEDSKQSYEVSVVGGENNLQNPDFPNENGVVFLFEIPSGKHQLDNWMGGEAYVAITPNGAMAPLQFDVKEGEVLYLGNIHMHLRFGKNFLGAPVIAKVEPELRHFFERDKKLLIKKYKALPRGKIVNWGLKKGIWIQVER